MTTEIITHKGVGRLLCSFHLPPRKYCEALVTVSDCNVVPLLPQQLLAGEIERPTFWTPATNAGRVARLSNHRLTTGNRSRSSATLSIGKTRCFHCTELNVVAFNLLPSYCKPIMTNLTTAPMTGLWYSILYHIVHNSQLMTFNSIKWSRQIGVKK